MYETIQIEKNKSNHFGIFFYKNSQEWNVFLDVCGLNREKFAVIYQKDLKNGIWKSFVQNMDPEDTCAICANEKESGFLRDFIDEKKKDYTFLILSEPFLMDLLQEILNESDYGISFVCVPVTPMAFLDKLTVLPKMNSEGAVIRKELFPRGVYIDLSILLEADLAAFQGLIAAAFRVAISYKASMYEWIILNMYELMEKEEEAVAELLERGYQVYKERIEKDTAKERSLPRYAQEFYDLLDEVAKDTSEADLWALAMVCQSYLSWKKDLISMEEYYEIRDMFVFFGLSITETFATDDTLCVELEKKANALPEGNGLFIRKIGKMVTDTNPGKEFIKEASSQIYYNEFDTE